MRVFVTGSTGQVGSYLVKELVAAGHDVTGLTRSEAGAEKLQQWGATPHMGDLNDINSLVTGVKNADATVHLAFIHDFSQFAQALDTDLAAVKAMLNVSQGKIFIGTTGLLGVIKSGPIATEDDPSDTTSFAGKRGQAEKLVREAADVKGAVIRLCPTVHFVEDVGFVPSLVQLARRSGFSAYPNAGDNHWPAVHRDDAARLYKIVVEKLANGSLKSGLAFHAVAESGLAAKDIANVIGEKLQLGEAVSKPAEHFGFLGRPFSSDFVVSSEQTRKLTGWQPTAPTLFETIRDPGFAPASLKTML
jgi:nucleoside-diphosphate-sugar epimerase